MPDGRTSSLRFRWRRPSLKSGPPSDRCGCTHSRRRTTMPHVIVKLWPGKSEQQKRRLAQTITDEGMKALHYGGESVSVAFEEVDANDWARQGVSAGHRTQGRHPLQETRRHDVTVTVSR